MIKEWSSFVKARDLYKCVICGDTKLLNAHHIIPKEDKLMSTELINGISLCPKHHKFDIVISAHRNPLAFYVWLNENRHEEFEYLTKYVKNKMENGTLPKMPKLF